MISDDLSSLFAPDAAGLTQDFSICLGKVLTYNPTTGANTIAVVGGATLVDVPVLRVGFSVSLTVGDTVVLAKIGHSYLVLGAVTQSNTANFGTDNEAWQVEYNTVTGFGSTTNLTLVTNSYTAPNSAQGFAIQITSLIKIQNLSGSTQNLQGQVAVNWTDVNGNAQTAASGTAIETMLASDIRSVSPNLNTGGSVKGGTTLTAQLAFVGIGATDGGATAQLNSMVNWARIF